MSNSRKAGLAALVCVVSELTVAESGELITRINSFSIHVDHTPTPRSHGFIICTVNKDDVTGTVNFNIDTIFILFPNKR